MSHPSLSAEQILEKALDAEMISVEQLHLLVSARLPTVILLDIRTHQEHRQGILSGSVLFPCAHDLDNLENTLPFSRDFHKKFRPEAFDRTHQYILICRTGPRTAIALETFLQHDLAACELLGGITEWQNKGLTLHPPDLAGKPHHPPLAPA